MQGEPGPTGAEPCAAETSAGTGHAPCTAGTKLLPRIFGGIRKEEPSSNMLEQLSKEKQLPEDTDVSADHPDKRPLGISVSLQTDESWLYEHSRRKMVQDYSDRSTSLLNKKQHSSCSESSGNDIYSDLVEDLDDLRILCDMELNADFLKCFEEAMPTFPSIGPPTILRYKAESSEKERDYSKIQMLVECSVAAMCEFCGKLLKPFPSNYLLSFEDPKQFFCCKEFQNLFESLFHEQKHLLEEHDITMIPIAPHPPHGSELERQRAKEKTAQRLRERQMAKYYASMAAISTESASLPEYGKQIKTITFQLSDSPPSKDNWTVSKSADEESDADDFNSITCDFTIACEKLMPRQFLERYYKHGVKFLTIFPDATAQLFYPSGNLAIIITHVNKAFMCIVQEDKSSNAQIQALFGSNGKGTCYHPNGNVWISIDTTGGQYSDKSGNRVRTWNWESNLASETLASFKPIFVSLNHNIGVRIFGQDRIIISFLSMGKQAKFSVGVKLQVQEPEVFPKLRREMHEEELLLLANKIKILSLFSRLHGCLSFSSKKQWDKFKPPSYLVSQTQKLFHLCRLSSVGGDIGASIKAILEGK